MKGVFGVVGEGDDDAVEGGVELFDAAEAPAFVLAEGAYRQGEEDVSFGDGRGERSARVGELGNGEDGCEARISLVDLGVGFDEFGAEIFVFGTGLGLEFESEEPFVKFAGGLEVGGDEGCEFGGGDDGTGVGEFFDEGEELFGLVGELFGEVEPEGLGGFPIALVE